MNRVVEINILVALMKATIEQTRMLNGEFKHKQKLTFNNFQIAGERWLSEIEGIETDTVFIDNLTDCIHDVCAEIRKELLLIIDKNELNNKI